ncbi:hypothetical protein C0J52_03449 [Blattella germanica]|nr:hypothetical protein C0J52_03449 [Blattella germanica]
MHLLLPVAIFVVFVGFASAGNPMDSLDDDQKEMLKMLHDSCVGDSGADEGLIAKAIKGDFTDDGNLKMDENGVPDMDTMISMLPASMQERGGKMIGSCKGVNFNSGDSYHLRTWSACN